MKERINFAASLCSLICLGMGLGIFAAWLFIRTEAALIKADDVQASQATLLKDLHEKIIPALQQQIDMSPAPFVEP